MMKGHVGYFYIDINGTKRPNKIGRDIFYFWLGDNGIVYPIGSMAAAEYTDPSYPEHHYWKTGGQGYTNNVQASGSGFGS